MFMSNSCPWFHLRQKENLVKHKKVSKYYKNDCMQNFLLLFMSILRAPIFKKSHILVKSYFIFLKNVLNQN